MSNAIKRRRRRRRRRRNPPPILPANIGGKETADGDAALDEVTEALAALWAIPVDGQVAADGRHALVQFVLRVKGQIVCARAAAGGDGIVDAQTVVHIRQRAAAAQRRRCIFSHCFSVGRDEVEGGV